MKRLEHIRTNLLMQYSFVRNPAKDLFTITGNYALPAVPEL